MTQLTDQLRHVLILATRMGGADIRTLDGAYTRAAHDLEANGLVRLNDDGHAYVVTNSGREALGLSAPRVV